jgi:hypothetical protein
MSHWLCFFVTFSIVKCCCHVSESTTKSCSCLRHSMHPVTLSFLDPPCRAQAYAAPTHQHPGKKDPKIERQMTFGTEHNRPRALDLCRPISYCFTQWSRASTHTMVEGYGISVLVELCHQLEACKGATCIRNEPDVEKEGRPMHSDYRKHGLHDKATRSHRSPIQHPQDREASARGGIVTCKRDRECGDTKCIHQSKDKAGSQR